MWHRRADLRLTGWDMSGFYLDVSICWEASSTTGVCVGNFMGYHSLFKAFNRHQFFPPAPIAGVNLHRSQSTGTSLNDF